jgi:hypothetical protein
MRLWTAHRNRMFSLTSGRVDHAQSEYYRDVPRVSIMYARLWQKLGIRDGQIIWCYTRAEDILITSIPKYTWELEVPDSSILAYIDDVVWNCLLGIKIRLTSAYASPIREEAAKKYPDDPRLRRQFETESEHLFWDHMPPESTLWERLFLEKPVDGSSALIEHPVPDEWVVSFQTVCCR